MSRYNKALQSVGAGAGIGTLVAWLWGLAMPETPMPPEVATVIAGILSALANMFMPANAP